MERIIAERAVDAIIKDLCGRRGLRQEWEGVDEDIRAEIREAWIAKALEADAAGEEASKP